MTTHLDESTDNRPRIPFAAKATGAWNGDMLYDWYKYHPRPEVDDAEWQLWNNIHDLVESKIKERVRQVLEELERKFKV